MKDKLNEEDLLCKLNDIICFDKTVKLYYNDIRFIFELLMNYREEKYKAIKYIKGFKSYIPEDNIPELLEILGDDNNAM